MSEIKRRKVLWLSHLVPYPPKGGVLQRSYNLLREMARYHDVYLLALIQPDLLKSQFKDVNKGLAEAQAALGDFCSRVAFVALPQLEKSRWKYREALRALLLVQPYTVSWLRSADAPEIVRAWHEEIDFDIVHVDTISLMPLSMTLKGVKKSLNHHNIESHMMLRRAAKETNILKKLYYYQEGVKILRYEKQQCKNVELQLVCSDLDAERLQEIVPGSNVIVVENGVDLEYFRPVADRQEKKSSLVFAGGLGWYPNLDAMRHFAVEVWPMVASRIADASMDVIGRGKDAVLDDTAGRYPLRYRVHGFVEDVRPYLTEASVYVCPIRDGGGTKLKVLDAMAMRKAMVAYPEACEGIDVIDGQHVLIVHSAEEMAKAVEGLLASDERRTRLGDAARELVERKYSFHNIGMKMAESYSRLC